MNHIKLLRKLKKEKKTKIDINNSSLIEYLINKKTISETLLNNLSHYNEDRMNRVNKICQRVTRKRKNTIKQKKRRRRF